MRVSDYIHALGSAPLISGLNIPVSVLHYCEVIIVREGETNYLVKDRFHNPYVAAIDNRKRVYHTDFKIISLDILKRFHRQFRSPGHSIINPGENLIIEIPER